MKISWIGLVVFFIAACARININFGGLINLSELLMLLFLPMLIIVYKNNYVDKKVSHHFVWTTITFIIWILTISVSDAYNNVAPENLIKGLGHPLFIALAFYTIYLALKINEKVLHYFMAGIVMANIYALFFIPLAANSFRFGGYPVLLYSTLFVSTFLWNKYPKKVIYGLFFLGTLALISGSRSNFLIAALTAGLLLIIERNKKIRKKIDIFSRQSVFVVLVLSLIGISIQNAYLYAVERGDVFSDEYQRKYEEQLNRGVPLIFAGRSEIFASSAAIIDAPIFGHGSWAVNPKYNLLRLLAIGDEIKTDHEKEMLQNHRIPAHSFILGAWVYNGIFATLFFLFFGLTLLKGMMYCINNSTHFFTVAFIFLSVLYFWHLFFSPLGVDKRIYVGFLLAVGGEFWSKSKYENNY